MIETIDKIPPENIYLVDATRRADLPFYDALVPAGFSNPADNHIRERLNLQDLCVLHPDCTYFVKAVGESMIGDYIYDGSILVVDATIPVETGRVIVAWVNGECCVKRFVRQAKMIMLESSNVLYPPRYVHLDRDQFSVLGVVTYIVSKPPKYVRPR
ncbi:LexA family protein [Spirosoma validum]|uniref:DNA repair protein n=1 Tax=Spirosoma validum TaxID=2771355 RepID=A0A927B1P4_9BACT|nr:S24 family peptidase [Spirosoma validum]MBD2753736.1 DNA repair protein [Spirosoma validum]